MIVAAGGLVARCMIEKVARSADPRTGQAREPADELVDKLFTYGTPHGGIVFDIGGGLVDWAMETFGPAVQTSSRPTRCTATSPRASPRIRTRRQAGSRT
ncbi:hypothetical protein OHA72_36430 [Dactylosporangium sp. NBC_01737]|uniref:hypothetical protein n=1 Tax=Dactylosporangium sp. NBC_01737 TaxID=2975959 RepID=UPI002E1521EF|nr:hypothetical protein OHA72_36430 [Dactylosporangium sp. NBC_01737]